MEVIVTWMYAARCRARRLPRPESELLPRSNDEGKVFHSSLKPALMHLE